MKRLVISVCMLLAACSESGEEPVGNKEPVCRITFPRDGAVLMSSDDLAIRGTGSDPDGNIVSAVLTVGGETVAEVASVPFRYVYPSAKLHAGQLVIRLRVEDGYGASAESEVSVKILDDSGETGSLSVAPESLDLGYYTEESGFTVRTDGEWTIEADGDRWLEIYDQTSGEWREAGGSSGHGTATVRLKSPANPVFDPRTSVLTVVSGQAAVRLTVTQQASPDMLMFLEDENLRIAAQLSCAIYGVDAGDGNGSDEPDWKVSAAEVETDPGIFGFDAGSYGVKSLKGIEYFPYLRHLDVNRNELTEVDLSGNPRLRSLHVEFNPQLETVDLSPVPELDEIGCDYGLFLTLDRRYLENMHTVGVLNRRDDEPSSTVDFSGCTKLARLYCYGNRLTRLDLSGCTGLWLLSASDNDFTELDLSDVDRNPDNMYILTDCPNLETVYVWKGFTRDYYNIFSVDDGVRLVEKE